MAKPFLKWVGGKTQILPQILEKIPREFVNYHEPFIGGGSVLLGVLAEISVGRIKMSGRAFASDKNDVLVYTYKNIQTRLDDVWNELNPIITEFMTCPISGPINRTPENREGAKLSRESYYYWIRGRYNNAGQSQKLEPIGSAMFIFLNKTCFRGLFRVGPNGFNVPYGHYKNPLVAEYSRLAAISALIHDVVFDVQDFSQSFRTAGPGDFIYLDPPYVPVNQKSFTQYTADGFNQHAELFRLICETPASTLLSNSNTKLVRDSFNVECFTVSVINCRRAINPKNPAEKTEEVLIYKDILMN